MKFTKMSLVAALLIGSSAFAIDNVKVSGDAKLFYATDNADGVVGNKNGIQAVAGNGTNDNSLFDAGSSAGQAALGLGVTADLAKGISAGAHMTVLSTLGLQGQLVNNVWEATNGTSDSWIMDQAWIAATLGKTTAKIGRMELDTPLVFSEKWSIVANTFEAAVVINQDIPDTTLVGAYVGGSNGDLLANSNGTTISRAAQAGAGIANVVAAKGAGTDTTFGTFYNGAFAAGAINNSFKPLTAQAWYYDAATNVALDLPATTYLTGVEAWWLQADLDASSLGIKGLSAGAQYTNLKLQLNGVDLKGAAYALMLGYEMKDLFTAKVAFSRVSDKDFGAGFNLAGTGQSKLYTEAWWNYGYVTQNDTASYNISITSPVQGLFDLGLYYTNVNQGRGNNDMTEFTATASKDVGPLNATLAFINTKADDQNIALGATKGSSYNSVQAYLTVNF